MAKKIKYQARIPKFLPQDFTITTWATLKPFYSELLTRKINSVKELEKWILDRNELDDFVNEDFNMRYVELSRNAADKKIIKRYTDAVEKITPKILPLEFKLNQKLIASPFVEKLDNTKYFIYLRNIRNEISLFREENIPLFTQINLRSKEHGNIFSKLKISINNQELTLQQATTLLEENDRNFREKVYKKIAAAIVKESKNLDNIFDELLTLRHQVALNAGFANYRDYMFAAMGRFDYSPEDCFKFHDAIEKNIIPIVDKLQLRRTKKLGLLSLRPWDLQVDISGGEPLRPYKTTDELINKSIQSLSKVDDYFGGCIQLMKDMQRLDLDSRIGKHPGGYNMPLPFSGVPFIFMNAANSLRDVTTIMHEAGHAVHSVLTKDFPLSINRSMPSEVAELASMTMELFTMDYWNTFFTNEQELQKAKIKQLEGVLDVLPWIATIDKFQHWIYTNPKHTQKQRAKVWMEIFNQFSGKVVDRTGLEKYTKNLWQKQLHIFEVPFYYIEYGMAQLGAIALWQQYRKEPKSAVTNYTNALKLGYTKTIGDTYAAANIQFDFSSKYVKSLASFVQAELNNIL